MTIEVKVTGIDEVIGNLEVMPKELDEELAGVVKWGALRLGREIRTLLSGRVVKQRSGRFIKSIREFFPEKLVAGVGSDFKGARLREYGTAGLPGGVLTPKRAKYIAVPLPGAMTGAGVSVSPRLYENTILIQSKLGNLIIMGGPLEERVPLFVLKSKVSQPAQRPFALAEKLVEPLVHAEAGKRIKKLIDGKSN